MKLILIDDDCLVVSALKMILENEPDFKVAATAHDGREALPLYREHSPDVLLMDIRMKEKNGLEAAEEICSNRTTRISSLRSAQPPRDSPCSARRSSPAFRNLWHPAERLPTMRNTVSANGNWKSSV